MPPPLPPPPIMRTIFNMSNGDNLTHTRIGFELANKDARTLPHGMGATVQLLQNFMIEDCHQMSINLADKKIRFTAIIVLLIIYRGLLDTTYKGI